MQEFIVHSIPGSPFGRTVLAMLEEKGASYRLSPVAPGTFRSPQHLARHPFGRVPVLEHNGFSLYETQAIQRYLDRVLPAPALTPADPRRAARMDQVMNVNDWYLFQGCGNVIGFQRVVGPKLMGLTPDLAAIEAAMPNARRVFNELGRLLGDKPYFAGDQVSLAEMMLIPQMDFMSQAPEWTELTVALPTIASWFERVISRPSFAATTWERVAAAARAVSQVA